MIIRQFLSISSSFYLRKSLQHKHLEFTYCLRTKDLWLYVTDDLNMKDAWKDHEETCRHKHFEVTYLEVSIGVIELLAWYYFKWIKRYILSKFKCQINM